MFIPSLVIKQLYTFNSLRNIEGGVQFSIKNRLSDATFAELISVKISEQQVPLDGIDFHLEDGTTVAATSINENAPL